MTTQLTRSPRAVDQSGTAAYALAGLVALGMAIYLVVTSPEFKDYETITDRLTDGVFVAYLLASIVAVVIAARHGLAHRATAIMVGIGYGLVTSAVLTMNVMEREPSWFMFVAGPGQLLAMAGFVWWAVWGRRTQVLGRGLTALCAAGGLTAIVGSEAGLTVLIAGFWFGLAARRD